MHVNNVIEKANRKGDASNEKYFRTEKGLPVPESGQTHQQEGNPPKSLIRLRRRLVAIEHLKSPETHPYSIKFSRSNN